MTNTPPDQSFFGRAAAIDVSRFKNFVSEISFEFLAAVTVMQKFRDQMRSENSEKFLAGI